jgi:hypothetical protein
MKITLAFDIERSGATDKYDTIAIGASVLDEEFKELDSLLLLGYVENKTQFEPRCWTEFWKQNTDMLNTLKYTGELEYEDMQREMIEQFQAFRSKWELFCKENDHELLLVFPPIFCHFFIIAVPKFIWTFGYNCTFSDIIIS